MFENIESIVVPYKKIKTLEVGTLTELNEPEGFFEKDTFETEFVVLEISYDSEDELNYDPLQYGDPLGMFTNNTTSNRVVDKPNILGRILNYNDLVSLELQGENEERIKTIYVPWCQKDQFDNRYMKAEKNNGTIRIEIRENIDNLFSPY